MAVAVGIDLGTTNSCVAVVQAGRARVVEDRGGRRIQPSVISFPPEREFLAGHAAKERLVSDAANTIFSFKRLIGRDFKSPEMERAMREVPYSIAQGPEGIPIIRARGREISLPEVSAMMLRHLRDMTQESLGVDIDQAVITAPANFNDVQRASTKVAGRIAGYNVMRILNEPTAAALAYGFGNRLEERIAIYDFGGGTFDITIVELQGDIFEVLATAGETYLGGDDFDDRVAEEMRVQFLKQHRYDLAEDPVAMQRVRLVAEKMKCQLSSLEEVQATLRELAYGAGGAPIDFSFNLTRKKFEQLVAPLVDRSLKVCEDALKLAGMDRARLDNLVLVGGTTRMPLVRAKVAEYFGVKPRTEINPDEVVAIGAAIHAYSLTGEELPDRPMVSVHPMGDRAGLASQTRSSKMPGRLPSSPPPPVPPPVPSSTTVAGAPGPFPLGPLPQREPSSDVQRTIHGLPLPTRGERGDATAKTVAWGAKPPPVPHPIPTKPPPGVAAAGLTVPMEPLPEETGLDVNFDNLPDVHSSEKDRHVVWDLPAPKPGAVDLPAPKPGAVDLPAPKPGAVDLPAPKPGAAHQPTRAGVGALPPIPNVPGQKTFGAAPPPPPPMPAETMTEPEAMAWPEIQPPPQTRPRLDAPTDLEDASWNDILGAAAAKAKTPPPPPPPMSWPAISPDFQEPAAMAPVPEPVSAPDPPPLAWPGGEPETTTREGLGAAPAFPSWGAPTAAAPVLSPPESVPPISGFGSLDAIFSEPPRDEVAGRGKVGIEPGTRESFSVSMTGKPSTALLLDVTPRALGVATTGGYCDQIIERNAAIPVEQTRLFTTSHDDQTEVAVEVVQGESRRTEENTSLGRVVLAGLRPAPRGDIKIRVTFEIDTDGILGVSARNEETGEAQATRIVLSGGLDDTQVEVLVKKYAAKTS
ncbi:MAG: Hsp70 family protein [Deltaproteobacteria bacterium]|nr:Hsp70 family protein [Deltaproteobacteria bacterium]